MLVKKNVALPKLFSSFAVAVDIDKSILLTNDYVKINILKSNRPS